MAINKRIIRSNDGGAEVTTSFNTVTYTGDGTLFVDDPHAITGVGFQPDLVWIKSRTSTLNHTTCDSVRGAGKVLYPNLTNGEVTAATPIFIDSFDSDGFTVNALHGGNTNENGVDFVAWCWKAGGAAVSVPNGIGTSNITQSVNVGAGFSITNYTGSVTGANKTIPHGLSNAPAVVIIKDRDWGVPNWFIWHKELTGDDYYLTFTSAGEAQNSAVFSAAPTNSVVNLGIDSGVGDRTDRYIAYCFEEIEGFSKFGSYSGTNSAGNFQDCGFEPAFIMFKITNQSNRWFMLDNKRDANPHRKCLNAALSEQEFSLGTGVNFLSTGFDFQGTGLNNSGLNFTYMAFANQF